LLIAGDMYSDVFRDGVGFETQVPHVAPAGRERQEGEVRRCSFEALSANDSLNGG